MALATIIRSPKSWLTSLRYGVSPHPPQAPENSNSGSRTWRTLDGVVGHEVAVERRDRLEEVPARSLEVAVLHAGSMLMDLWLTPSCSWRGRRRRRRRSRCSRPARPGWSAGGRGGRASGTPCWEIGRRRARAAVGKTFIRIVACGQTMAHFPQSMQIGGSQTGISWAMARFSYFACR